MGEDVGSWGQDIESSFPVLLQTLITQYNFTLLLGNMDVKWFMDYYQDMLPYFTNGRIKQITFGVQHFDETVLTSMNRNLYNLASFKEKISTLKSLNVDVTFYLIGCYPSETEQQFDFFIQNLIYFRDLGVKTTIFPFHRKEGTNITEEDLSQNEFNKRLNRIKLFGSISI